LPYTYEWRKSQFLATFKGNVVSNEVFSCSDIFESDSRFDDLRSSIWDFSAVDSVSISVEEIIGRAAIDRAASKSNRKIKLAIFTNRPSEEIFANLYKAENLDIDWDIKIFKTKKEALEWCS